MGVRLTGLAVAMLVAAAGPAMAKCQLGRFAELPLTLRGFVPIVQVRLDDRPVDFVLDSGAFFSTISPASARELGLHLKPAPFGLQMRGIGGAFDVSIASVRQVGVGAATISNVEFMVGGSGLDTGIGLLGQNFLGAGDAEYDVGGGVVRLFRETGCNKSGFAYWAPGGSFSVPLRSDAANARMTVATVKIDGVSADATFDTGAARSVVSLRIAARAGVRPGGPGVVPSGWSSGLGRRVGQAWNAPFKALQIGDETLQNIRLEIADLGPDIDMLLGTDFFMAHRLFVSNAQHRIDFTYNGGRVFDSQAHADPQGTAHVAAPTGTDPADAEAFARRGALFATQHDLTRALADDDRAVALEPTEVRYRRQRASARFAAGQPRLAVEDYTAILALSPDDADARLSRAELHIAEDRDGALADVDAVATRLAPASDLHLRVASLYTDLDAFDRARRHYDLWITAYPNDARRAQALNGRCWARGLAGVELPRALADCDAALRAMPKAANVLDSRGLVLLRQGENARAIEAYDAVLAIQPNTAWSLFGRGVAERRLGQTDKAARDIAAASAIDSHIPVRAKRLGIE